MSSSISEVGRAAPARLSAHLTLVRNAVSLYGSTVVTSALGFAFWYVVARRFAPSEAGYASAVVSAMQLLGTFCVVGLNTLLISELSADARRLRALLSTALASVTVVAVVGGLVTAVVLAASSKTFAHALGSPATVLLFTAGVVVTTMTLVVDDACIGLLRGELQLARNTFFAVGRLILLPLAALLWPLGAGMQIYAVWTAASAASLAVLLARLARTSEGQSWRPRLALVRHHGAVALQHHWLNTAMQVPRLVTPVVAAVTLGPGPAAALYAASLMVSFVNIIPTHLTTALFALRPGDHAAMRRSVRFTMTASAGLAVVTAPAVWIGAGFALGLFRDDYLSARTAMVLLGLTTLPAALKAHFIAISRVEGRLAAAAVLSTLGAVVEVALAAGGARVGGLTGLAAGLLVAQTVQALGFLPTVLRALAPQRRDLTTAPCTLREP